MNRTLRFGSRAPEYNKTRHALRGDRDQRLREDDVRAAVGGAARGEVYRARFDLLVAGVEVSRSAGVPRRGGRGDRRGGLGDGRQLQRGARPRLAEGDDGRLAQLPAAHGALAPLAADRAAGQDPRGSVLREPGIAAAILLQSRFDPSVCPAELSAGPQPVQEDLRRATVSGGRDD